MPIAVRNDVGVGFEPQADSRTSSKKSVTWVSAPVTCKWVGLGTGISSSTDSIGTFWYAWIPQPFEDFLATKPDSVTPPAGWTDTITNIGAHDGYGIEFNASGTANNLQPGSSLDFGFTSADTPASVNGDSVFYPRPGSRPERLVV